MPNNNNHRKKVLSKVWKKTNGVCAHCGAITYHNKTIDHIIPKCLGGGNDIDNLAPLCEKCNKKKSDTLVRPYNYYKYLPVYYIRRFYHYKNEVYCSSYDDF